MGFEFIDFVNLCRWERNAFTGLVNCTFGDALFLRTPEFMAKSNLSEQKIAKYIAVLYIYNRFDLIDALWKIDDSLNTKFKGVKRVIKKKIIHIFKSAITFDEIYLYGIQKQKHTTSSIYKKLTKYLNILSLKTENENGNYLIDKFIKYYE